MGDCFQHPQQQQNTKKKTVGGGDRAGRRSVMAAVLQVAHHSREKLLVSDLCKRRKCDDSHSWVLRGGDRRACMDYRATCCGLV